MRSCFGFIWTVSKSDWKGFVKDFFLQINKLKYHFNFVKFYLLEWESIEIISIEALTHIGTPTVVHIDPICLIHKMIELNVVPFWVL